MKKYIAVLLCFCLCLTFLSVFQFNSHADALTAAALGAGVAAFATAASLNFVFSNMAGNGTQNFFTNLVTEWTGGQNLTELFEGAVISSVGGKLIIPATIATWIAAKLSDLIDAKNIETPGDEATLSFGMVNNYPISAWDKFLGGPLYSADTGDGVCLVFGTDENDNDYIDVYVSGVNKGRLKLNPQSDLYNTKLKTGEYGIVKHYSGGSLCAKAHFQNVNKETGSTGSGSYPWKDLGISNPNQNISVVNAGYNAPTVDVGYKWEGDIAGAESDTNLDQLIGTIFEDIADTNLSVDAEVVPDTPVTPTPVPTPVTDILDGINTQIGQLDGIGNDIGNIADHLDDLGDTLDDVNEGIADIPGAIEGQTGVISGAINHAISDIQSAIGTQTGALTGAIDDVTDAVDSLEDTLVDALAVPSAAEAANFKFNLSTLFPFCIPFDIVRMLNAFDGIAAAPHYRIPIVIDSIGFSYTLDLDFQIFDPVAAVLRQVELIAFGIALAYATSKVIRW